MSGFPHDPGYKVAGHSADAAERVAPSAKTLRAEVLRTLITTAHGLTADQIAIELNRSILSVRPRVSELHRLGLVRPTERRGRNESGMSATVWVASRSNAEACS